MTGSSSRDGDTMTSSNRNRRIKKIPGSDWEEHISSKNKVYFYNTVTEVSQWDPPKELAHLYPSLSSSRHDHHHHRSPSPTSVKHETRDRERERERKERLLTIKEQEDEELRRRMHHCRTPLQETKDERTCRTSRSPPPLPSPASSQRLSSTISRHHHKRRDGSVESIEEGEEKEYRVRENRRPIVEPDIPSRRDERDDRDDRRSNRHRPSLSPPRAYESRHRDSSTHNNNSRTSLSHNINTLTRDYHHRPESRNRDDYLEESRRSRRTRYDDDRLHTWTSRSPSLVERTRERERRTSHSPVPPPRDRERRTSPLSRDRGTTLRERDRYMDRDYPDRHQQQHSSRYRDEDDIDRGEPRHRDHHSESLNSSRRRKRSPSIEDRGYKRRVVSPPLSYDDRHHLRVDHRDRYLERDYGNRRQEHSSRYREDDGQEKRVNRDHPESLNNRRKPKSPSVDNRSYNRRADVSPPPSYDEGCHYRGDHHRRSGDYKSYEVDRSDIPRDGERVRERRYEETHHRDDDAMDIDDEDDNNQNDRTSPSYDRYRRRNRHHESETASTSQTFVKEEDGGRHSTTPRRDTTMECLSPSQVTMENLEHIIDSLSDTPSLPDLRKLSREDALKTIRQVLRIMKEASLGIRSSKTPTRTVVPTDPRGDPRSSFSPTKASRHRTSEVNGGNGTAASAATTTFLNRQELSIPSPNSEISGYSSPGGRSPAGDSGVDIAAPPKASSSLLSTTLVNSFREDLIEHVKGWQGDHIEKQGNNLSKESHSLGNNCTRVSAELKMARSLVRFTEIQATLQEQRVLFLRQQMKDVEDWKSQHVPFAH